MVEGGRPERAPLPPPSSLLTPFSVSLGNPASHPASRITLPSAACRLPPSVRHQILS